MAVFRVEKTKDFTVMSNYHLRDVELSLKAKGLLSLMLSLPEDWDYTTKGLAYICKDGVDSITSALKELESHGYLTRQRTRYENGQLGTSPIRYMRNQWGRKRRKKRKGCLNRKNLNGKIQDRQNLNRRSLNRRNTHN